jgi:hypothetical protein
MTDILLGIHSQAGKGTHGLTCGHSRCLNAQG